MSLKCVDHLGFTVSDLYQSTQWIAARARWSFSYFVTRSPDQTRPVIEALR